MYSPLGQKKAAPRPPTLTQTRDITLIPTKRLPIAPPDPTERTLPKEAEEDIPSDPEEEEEAEAVAALPAQEGDTTAMTSCSVNTLTPSPEMAPKHGSSSHSGNCI